jgi:hypothetical protein
VHDDDDDDDVDVDDLLRRRHRRHLVIALVAVVLVAVVLVTVVGLASRSTPRSTPSGPCEQLVAELCDGSASECRALAGWMNEQRFGKGECQAIHRVLADQLKHAPGSEREVKARMRQLVYSVDDPRKFEQLLRE